MKKASLKLSLRALFCPLFLAAFSFLAFALTSCSQTIGYGIVLWNITEHQIPDGTVVPVYIKSNISHTYVIGVPDSEEKIEVPLWKITSPESKKKALKHAEKYTQYAQKYARCNLNGLPIREDAVNTSKQVYRLRKDEIVRVLYEGDGVIPTNGVQNLEGIWLRVLTSDGNFGWCFSYNLKLFTINADGSFGEGAESAEVYKADETLEAMLNSAWYPDYYSRMISSGNINLDDIQTNFGFDTGINSGTVRICIPSLNVSFPYSGVTKVDDYVYKFNDTTITVTIRKEKTISVQYIDQRGMPKSFNFTTLSSDIKIADVITREKNSRNELYKAIVNLGPTYKSTNYGLLTFNSNGTFEWTGYKLLVPSVISSSAQTTGNVEIKYFLTSDLKKSYDGVLTFTFDGMEEEVNFVYKKETAGLRLTVASVTKTKNETTNRTTATVRLPATPQVIFFQK